MASAYELMSALLPARILAHVASPLSYAEDASSTTWVEGEPGATPGEPTVGAPFACVLFMPGPGGQANTGPRMRTVREPTLLFNPPAGPVPGAEDELLITAPELEPLTGAVTARWLMVGDPQPFGPPGVVGGYQATVRQVKD